MRAGAFCCHRCYQVGTSPLRYFHLLYFCFCFLSICPHKLLETIINRAPHFFIRHQCWSDLWSSTIEADIKSESCRTRGIAAGPERRCVVWSGLGRDEAQLESGEWMKVWRTFAYNYMYKFSSISYCSTQSEYIIICSTWSHIICDTLAYFSWLAAWQAQGKKPQHYHFNLGFPIISKTK